MNQTMLRNAVLFAFAIDATPEEIDYGINAINRFFERDGISPASIPTAVAGPGSTALQTTTVGNDDDGAPDNNAPTVDKNGLPWDARIHSSSKGMNKDGTWRSRKGVDEKYVKQIEAALRSTIAAGQSATTDAAPVQTTVPGLPPLPTPGATPSLPPLPNAVNPKFTAFVEFVGANMQAVGGRLTDQWLKTVLMSLGCADGDIQNLAHAPELLDKIDAYVRTAVATP